jgi:hypothetical protein
MPGAVCLRGECKRLGDSTEFRGEWGLTPDDITNPGRLSNSFTYKLSDNDTDNIEMSQTVPSSGKYIGYFLYDVDRTEIRDELDLKFVENDAGTYNVYGSGLTKEFGPVKISGIFEGRGKLTINKIPIDEITLPVPADDMPPPLSTPSPIQICESSVNGDEILLFGNIQEEESDSSSFRYVGEWSMSDDPKQRYPFAYTSIETGVYVGCFALANDEEITDEFCIHGTYNLHGIGKNRFGSFIISGIREGNEMTLSRTYIEEDAVAAVEAPSPPTPRRTTKRRRTIPNFLHADFVGYTESGDLVEDDVDGVDEDLLDEYESDLESGSAEDEEDEDVLDEYEYKSALESGSAPEIEFDPSDSSSNDTTYLYGKIAFEISSGRVIFSGEEWTPDEDSTQGYPFYYSASQLESGTFTGSFCHSTNEVITDELSIELERNGDGTSQVHGSGNNRFGSFVVSGKCDGVEMILYRTYTHVEEDTTEDEPQPLFSKGESFVNMKPKCSNSDCNHNHGVVSPSNRVKEWLTTRLVRIYRRQFHRSYSLHYIETSYATFSLSFVTQMKTPTRCYQKSHSNSYKVNFSNSLDFNLLGERRNLRTGRRRQGLLARRWRKEEERPRRYWMTSLIDTPLLKIWSTTFFQ